MLMRRKQRRRRRSKSEVELNLAAMLDMAFQLLMFFILTFKPAPVEGDILLRMPPPAPTTVVQGGQAPGANAQNTNPVQGLNSLVISLLGNPDGSIRQIVVGDTPVPGLGVLEGKLKVILGDPSVGFDQVILQVGSAVHYEQLMQVIDVCTRQHLSNGKKLSKLSIVELPGG
jgi:biopolymer transport protein ExbD